MQSVHVRKDDKVFEIIDNVLKQAFGDIVTQIVYDSLDRHYSLKQSEISNNIGVFTDCLRDFLGEGAYPIENKILSGLLAACRPEDGVSLKAAVPEEIAALAT